MSRLETNNVLEGDHLEHGPARVGDLHAVVQAYRAPAQYMIGYYVAGAAHRFDLGSGQVGEIPAFLVDYVYIIKQVQVIAGHGD
ncbi:MAG: hypothetical protein AABZ73_00425 [Pseudomonadota bacterium]